MNLQEITVKWVKPLMISFCILLFACIIRIKTKRLEISWQDHLRWFLEGFVGRVFSWAYAGSDEELQDVVDGLVPVDLMSPRQLVYLNTLADSDYCLRCSHCNLESPIMLRACNQCAAIGRMYVERRMEQAV